MRFMTVLLVALFATGPAWGGEVAIRFARFIEQGDAWRVLVTLEHADTGWDHYADAWRVVDGQGNVLGNRVLRHPHVEEQPFTRGLSGVKIPSGTSLVYVEAHDKVHGWSSDRLEVDLLRGGGKRYRVER